MAEQNVWTETNGVWKRSLGAMENFYLSLASPVGQPVHWMIGCGVSVAYHGSDKVDIESVLKQAWKDTCLRFPGITATVDPVEKQVVVGPSDAVSVDAWVEKSFLVHDGVEADDLFASFKSQLCITLHYLRDKGELVVQAQHVLLDGRGILSVLDAMFSALSGSLKYATPVSGTETLSKSLDSWLNFSQVPSPQNIEDAQSLFTRFMQEKPVALPEVDFTRTPKRSVHRELHLDLVDTQKVVRACKSRGFTVTTAWHAALTIAIQKLQSRKGVAGTSYTQFTTIDLRRWFPEPFQRHKDSVACLQTALPFVVKCGEGSSFDTIAKGLQHDYKNPFEFAHGDLSCLLPGMAMYRQLVESGQVPPNSTPSLSSMGVVDDILKPRYGDWELDGYWVSSTMMTGDFQVYLWTWRGQMVFSACFNDGFYEVERADGILLAISEEMKKGLGVD
ncbi:hypothetical protein NLG97_g7249 [Lecanicillium saksenae]|uniref:Uncharacterized protein n=1 Tax=Lecanicillium saksenae TaxID=468837 RepID=A0ACC1QNM4_9HYPO|nr:hypothetical protein NLG97_g7249 [Lecanicillium saksenae]